MPDSRALFCKKIMGDIIYCDAKQPSPQYDISFRAEHLRAEENRAREQKCAAVYLSQQACEAS